MVMADLMLESGAAFAVAHCNFCLRGKESDDDEKHVERWCSANGIRFHAKSFDTTRYAAAQGISIEMAARQLRYEWFASLCKKFSYSALLVAHNARDNAETVVLNLLRGTGLKGLCGMRKYGTVPVPGCTLPLLRPLLDFDRTEIEEYAAARGLVWREDSTNSENEVKRNKLRNLVFPVFAQINPSFVKTINEDAERFAADACLLEALDRKAAGDRGGDAGSGVKTALPSKPELLEEKWEPGSPVRQAPGVLILDADKIKGRLSAHSRQAGDWLRPLGAPGRKKVQDWFTDHHIRLEDRQLAVIFKDDADEDRSHVAAIFPYCIDDRYRVTPGTRRIIRISASKGNPDLH